MNLIVPPTVDLYMTIQREQGLVPRPPGDGWSLAGIQPVGNAMVFLWTQTNVERVQESIARVAEGAKG